MNNHNDTVTVVVTRKVKWGRESQYEDWLRRLLNESKSMKGYIGATSRSRRLGRRNTQVFLDLTLSIICVNLKNQNCVPVPARSCRLC